jgi:hypothetical protein
MQGFLSYQIPNHVGVLPLVETGAVLHVLGYVITSLIPSNADLFALVKATTKHSSWQESDADISERWQGSPGVVALMVLDEILLAIKDAVTANHNTRPIFSGLMHPHFMLLPI